MKTLSSLVFALLFLALAPGCGGAAEPAPALPEEGPAETPASSAETVDSGLTQNGDYSTLFNSPDCKVISAEEISAALGITVADMNLPSQCAFQSQFPGNKIWYLSILRENPGQRDIQREIQNFQADETGQLTAEISETGDTYFCTQHRNGYLSIYNPNYDGSVLIRYGSVAESRGFTAEERLEHQDMAKKLANALLQKHQR